MDLIRGGRVMLPNTMDHGTVPPTADQTEEGDDSLDADHVGVRAWVTSLFSR